MSIFANKTQYENVKNRPFRQGFLRSAILLIAGFAICLVAFGTTTFALFNRKSESEVTIKSARYGLRFTLDGESSDYFMGGTDFEKAYTAAESQTTHTLKIDLLSGSDIADVGFCMITVDDRDENGNDRTRVFFTDTLGTGGASSYELIFDVLNAGEITIKPHWGIAANYSSLPTPTGVAANQGTVQIGVLELSGNTFTTKFQNTDKYLYRVGNGNAVKLGSLFKLLTTGENAVNSSDVKIRIESVETTASVNGTGTNLETGSTAQCVYTPNGSNWENATLQFTGEGPVKVTIKEGSTGRPYTLNLEVVEAMNTTTAMSATANNVVLLGDVSVSGMGGIQISNGYALFGNGFRINCTGNGSTNGSAGLGGGFVRIDSGGLLDNAVVVAPDFAKAYMYVKSNPLDYYIEESENVVSADHYAYQLSAVRTSGDATISNSYIYGARNNVHAEGVLTIDHCTLVNGSLSNIHMDAQEGTLYLKDVTTIQYSRTFDYQLPGQTAKTATVMGFGILMGPRPDSGVSVVGNPTLNIAGYLNQYNWVCADDGNITSSRIAKQLITKALSESAYQHTSGGKTYVNLGVVYLNNASSVINDARSGHGYVKNSISMSGVNGQVYAPGAGSSQVELKDSSYEYQPDRQGIALPKLSYNDSSDQVTVSQNSAFDYSFTVALGAGESYLFDFSKLNVRLSGSPVSYVLKDSSEITVSSDSTFQMNTAGTTRYTIEVELSKLYDAEAHQINVDSKTFRIEIALIADIADLPEPVKLADPAGTYYKMTNRNSTSSDWSMAAAPLDGLQIKYWSTEQNKEVVLDFSNISINKTTSNSLTISGNDWSLAMTSTAIKDGKTNIWLTASGVLYVTASTSDQVSSDTSARTTTITYTFSDDCGHTLASFSKQFYCKKPASGDTLYSHRKLVEDGVLTTNFSGGGGGGNTGCLAAGTLITLADGTQKPVELLTGEENLLVWNLETGTYDVAPIVFVDSDPIANCDVIHAQFSNGSDVEIVYEHGFFDLTLEKYVYINEATLNDYVGHEFVVRGDCLNNTWETAFLSNTWVEERITVVYSPVTYKHLCYFTNDMLSMPGGIDGLFNIFDVDTTRMAYDQVKMAEDIAQYGLFTYSDYEGIIPEMAYEAFNGAWLKVAIGKGLLTWEDICYLADRYSVFWE